MNPGPYEDDTGDEERGESRRSGLVAMVIGVVALAAFGGAMWYAYDLGVQSGGDGAVPVVSAPEGPVKRRPVEEGGIEVPFQDKLVYERLNRAAPETEQVERLLPPPETPMARPALPVEPPPVEPAPTAPSDPIPSAPALPERSVAPAAPATEPPAAVPPSAAKPAMPPADAAPPVSPPPVSPPPVSPPPRVTSPPGGDAIRVQLASVRSEADARATWERLRKAHGDLLGKFSLHVDRADLGADRGVYFRVQAGPVSEAALAQLLCGQLKSRGVECLIVK